MIDSELRQSDANRLPINGRLLAVLTGLEPLNPRLIGARLGQVILSAANHAEMSGGIVLWDPLSQEYLKRIFRPELKLTTSRVVEY